MQAGRALVRLLACGALLAGCTGSPSISPSIVATPSAVESRPLTVVTPTAAPATPSPSSSALPTPVIGSLAPDIDGVSCEGDEQLDYHVHAHLNVRVRGAAVEIPAGIGLAPSCIYWLHTHGDIGMIHIEAAAPAAFTLGQFFDIWGKPLSSAQIGDVAVGKGESIFAFLNGKRWDGDPRSIPLVDHAIIDLQVGSKPLAAVPYTFPDGY